MPTHSKRMFRMMIPYEGASGKLAHVLQTVSKKNPGFRAFVAITNGNDLYTQRFSVRTKPLSGELTADQKANQAKFANVAAQVKTILADVEQSAVYREAFLKQTAYKTLRGYIFAELMAV